MKCREANAALRQRLLVPSMVFTPYFPNYLKCFTVLLIVSMFHGICNCFMFHNFCGTNPQKYPPGLVAIPT